MAQSCHYSCSSKVWPWINTVSSINNLKHNFGVTCTVNNNLFMLRDKTHFSVEAFVALYILIIVKLLSFILLCSTSIFRVNVGGTGGDCPNSERAVIKPNTLVHNSSSFKPEDLRHLQQRCLRGRDYAAVWLQLHLSPRFFFSVAKSPGCKTTMTWPYNTLECSLLIKFPLHQCVWKKDKSGLNWNMV